MKLDLSYQKKSIDDPSLVLGEINGFFGLQGWVKVYSNMSPVENILKYKSWWLSWKDKKNVVLYRVIRGKVHGKGVIVQLEGILDRTSAENLFGAKISIFHSELKPSLEGEYYWSELIGLEVVNEKNECLGSVDGLIETGANDVLVVKKHGKECLVPFINPWILSVDMDKKVIFVKWDFEF